MSLQYCYNASEDTFPLPQGIKDRYGPFGFPEPRDPQRPYISSNFVMGLDGRVSFRELKGRAGGREVSKSREDRWLMDFLRAHHDGQLIGADTLAFLSVDGIYRAMGEPGRDPAHPKFTDHCFTGDYPTPLTDMAQAEPQPRQLSLLAEAS